jgi:hypothetical protein
VLRAAAAPAQEKRERMKAEVDVEGVQLGLWGSGGGGNSVPSSYGNLSCPWEWSKYSCAHQGQDRASVLAYLYSQDMLTGEKNKRYKTLDE